MHELLVPAALSVPEALERCDRYLRSRWRGWLLTRPTFFDEERRGLLALSTWHEMARQTARAAADDDVRGRALDELTETLEEVFAERPRNAIGIALAPVVQRLALPALLFRGPLEERRNERHVHTFDTRADLAGHARRIARPEGQLLLTLFDERSERNDILVEALTLGIQISSWLTHLSEDLAQGHLFLAIEDINRHGVDLRALREGTANTAVRSLVAQQIQWARSQLAKGWPLTLALGALRGRQLACFLRWHAASLSALEARDHDALAGPPPAGLLRLIACGTLGLASPHAPF